MADDDIVGPNNTKREALLLYTLGWYFKYQGIDRESVPRKYFASMQNAIKVKFRYPKNFPLTLTAEQVIENKYFLAKRPRRKQKTLKQSSGAL
jgi:hypothetical protein